ncbi:MAG: hypothetical protein AAF658_16540 [Myxococcota bacterium]
MRNTLTFIGALLNTLSTTEWHSHRPASDHTSNPMTSNFRIGTLGTVEQSAITSSMAPDARVIESSRHFAELTVLELQSSRIGSSVASTFLPGW